MPTPKKAAAAKKAVPEQEVTGPSSDPKAPLVTMGQVAAPVVRTAGQGGAAWTVMEIIEAYSLYDFTDRQWAITLVAGTVAFSWLQNQIEALRGRRLVGTRD